MTKPNHPIDKDQLTGVETTGHEWDGLKELNLPAPRWWLWVFFATIIWSIGYWVLYPAWPTLSGHTEGSKGWTQYTKLADEQAEIAALRGEFQEKLKDRSLEQIQNNPDLYAFAIAGGKAMFKENCAACHGTGAAGGPGYPNLNDDEWLWGGDVNAIYQTLQYGVRSGHEESRDSQMPPFGKAGLLTRNQIGQVADYVLTLSDATKPAAPEGQVVFQQNCVACHGEKGEGNRALGAPNLADAIWLYGGEKAQIIAQVHNPRHGVMPAWVDRLPDVTIKQLALYVHSLGGGEGEAVTEVPVAPAPVEAAPATEAAPVAPEAAPAATEGEAAPAAEPAEVPAAAPMPAATEAAPQH